MHRLRVHLPARPRADAPQHADDRASVLWGVGDHQQDSADGGLLRCGSGPRLRAARASFATPCTPISAARPRSLGALCVLCGFAQPACRRSILAPCNKKPPQGCTGGWGRRCSAWGRAWRSTSGCTRRSAQSGGAQTTEAQRERPDAHRCGGWPPALLLTLARLQGPPGPPAPATRRVLPRPITAEARLSPASSPPAACLPPGKSRPG